ncbi:hypothetical protein SAMN04489806_3082 [Paramicrobacterium humi]|uniref:Asparagine synthase n=1 Tax=Paramicrobacterium humi TaxID=640635 RepID=A0A1H4T262_9MICO|nr:hypothetical protein [Microbacterium humi]SEC50583.1 hypothetical protein SAMN04489806_3082 [Microbacterium humi]
MPFFSRLRPRKRTRNVGKYVAPKEVRVAPIEQVVEEGVLIALSSVRMAVKNALIVGALRDDQPYDVEKLTQSAREHVLSLAAENDQTASRLERARGFRKPDPDDDEAHRRRPQVHRMLAEALRERADDGEQMDAIIERARTDAWEDIGREVRNRIGPPGFIPDQPDVYERMRDSRMKRLVDIDLASLDRERRAEEKRKAKQKS